MEKELIHKMEKKYQDYLTDESKWVGQASSISFPENETEIKQILHEMQALGIPVTIQGGKTGLVAGAAPAKGHILNLSRMDKLKDFYLSGEGEPFLIVEPGVTLHNLNTLIRRLDHSERLFWPPDPTETLATVGGIAACGAKGSREYLYGDTKKYITAIKVIDAKGTIHVIQRGENSIELHGQSIDLLDFYLGSEGLYGIITEITLKLIEKPKGMWAVAFFFDEKANSFAFANNLREHRQETEQAAVAAIEFFDRATIQLIEEYKNTMAQIKDIPEPFSDASAMIYVEIHGSSDQDVEAIAANLLDLYERCQGDPDRTWAFIGENEVEKLRAYRHAAPAAVNLKIAKAHQKEPGISKLSTNLELSIQGNEKLVTERENDLVAVGLQACIFGHISGSHLHLNILPATLEEYKLGYQLFERWAQENTSKKSVLFAEHGVGKIKKPFFLKYTPSTYIEEIQRYKDLLDPHHLLNPGNVLEGR